MRQLASKSLAGGLSAGVVLLWWPMLFASDSAASWLARGVAWTVLFEFLVHAFGPLESALWATQGGERLRRRVIRARSRLGSGSTRGRLGWSAGMAVAAVAVAAALLAAGLHEGGPVEEPEATKVVRVTRVVRPVTVKRVVRRVAAPASAPVVSLPAQPARAAAPSPRPTEQRRTSRRAPRRRAARRAPSKAKLAPDAVQTGPDEAPACEGDGCTIEPAPAAGSSFRVRLAKPRAEPTRLG